MMMTKNHGFLIKNFVMLVSVLILVSCNQNNKPEKAPEPIKVYIDQADYALMEPLLLKADSIFKDYRYEYIRTTAFDAMKRLLSDTVFMAAIIARDYSYEETEKMIQFKVEPRTRQPLARDALVFFTDRTNPLDTIADWQVKKYFTDPGATLQGFFPELKTEPRFAITNHLSSEFENLRAVVLNYSKIVKPFVVFSTIDSVKNFVLENKNDIGVGYLSQIVNDDRFKALRVSFIDSTGKYVKPTIVHQTTIVMGKYPYEIKHYMYLYNQSKVGANKLLRFMAKSPIAQQYFNMAGIVPAFGRFRLIQED